MTIHLLAGRTLLATEGENVLDEPQFVESWIEALREAGVTTVFEAGNGVEIFGVEDGARTSYFYGREAYERYLEDPSSKEEQISLLVSIVRKAAHSSARTPALSKLVPLLRSRRWLERAEVNDIPSIALPGGPVVVLAEDQGDSIRHLRSQDLASLARPFAELVSLAVGNLRSIAPVRQEDLGSVFMLTSGGDYEASLALDKDLIASVSENLGGDAIFAIPTTDVFLIGRREQSALEALVRAVGGVLLDGEEPLSSSIYQYRNSELTEFAQVRLVQGKLKISMFEEL